MSWNGSATMSSGNWQTLLLVLEKYLQRYIIYSKRSVIAFILLLLMSNFCGENFRFFSPSDVI
ncbi:uncharacterized protein Dana_GF27559, isoform B [Drosophila ananassae]|uniref:Uncharacterized protein, isoform B n=1 Tax=Drosophila ananassae TaxID=7217 RepID=A0A0P8XVY2_DROAN|nr:uncharacterized protein Dana_GF27559, isoform B [Drosophila ananassae]